MVRCCCAAGSTRAGRSGIAAENPGRWGEGKGGDHVTRQVITWKPDNERLKINFAGEKVNWPERMQSAEVLGENPVTFIKKENGRS